MTVFEEMAVAYDNSIPWEMVWALHGEYERKD